MVYEQEILSKNKFKRTFNPDVDSSELVWHRDKKSRLVEITNDTDWMFQMENQLPKKLNKGDLLFIPKESFHRVIKGNGTLEIIITEEKSVRIPKSVISKMEIGKKYASKSKIRNPKIDEMIKEGETDFDTILEFKKFFDGKPKNITLNESFKGQPHNDIDYVEWLLRGGDLGQKWVNKVVREYNYFNN
jgi:hypothetical protein